MLAKYRLSWIFVFCLLGTILVPSFFPFCRFLFFTPFLIVSFYQSTLWVTTWRATGVGIIDDLLSTAIFGASSCNYVLTTILLYRLKRHFFEDNASTLFIMTLLFSCVSIIIKVFLGKILGQSFPISFGFLVTDILLMPIFEGIYAYVIFVMPYLGMKMVKKLTLQASRD